MYMHRLDHARGKQNHKQGRSQQPVLTKELHSLESSTRDEGGPRNFVLQSSLLCGYNRLQPPLCCGSLKVPLNEDAHHYA